MLTSPLLPPSYPVPAPQIRFTILALYKLVCMYVCKAIVKSATEVLDNLQNASNFFIIRLIPNDGQFQ